MTATIELPPSGVDLRLARAIAKHASPVLERAAKPITYLADEKLVLGAATAFWLACRATRPDSEARACADQIIVNAALAMALPHLIKLFVNRERPDRKVVHGFRHGIPRSGNAWDSFPSGHSMQLGALAASGARMLGPGARRLVWPAALALASTRLVLRAHYLSDVAAGLALGVAIDRLVSLGRSLGSRRRSRAAAKHQGARGIAILNAPPPAARLSGT